jgi:protein gp37
MGRNAPTNNMTTNISWTDETWNPIVGCSRISEGCKNCYAAIVAASPRLQQFEQYQNVKNWDGSIRFVYNQLEKPLKWRKPKKIFTCSMSDLFHKNVENIYRDRVFEVIEKCPQHTFQILTKRPENAVDYFGYRYGDKSIPDNIWFGVTAETEAMANARIDVLVIVKAKVRWVSFEPLLEDIDLTEFLDVEVAVDCMETPDDSCEINVNYFDWAVVGGESGSDRRNVDIAWIESIVNQCQDANVPIWVKQDSAYQSEKQGKISNELWSIKQFPKQKPKG